MEAAFLARQDSDEITIQQLTTDNARLRGLVDAADRDLKAGDLSTKRKYTAEIGKLYAEHEVRRARCCSHLKHADVHSVCGRADGAAARRAEVADGAAPPVVGLWGCKSVRRHQRRTCCVQADRANWEREREELLDQIDRFRISAEGLEVAVMRERKEKEVMRVQWRCMSSSLPKCVVTVLARCSPCFPTAIPPPATLPVSCERKLESVRPQSGRCQVGGDD